ncbi:MAG: sodium:proton exchanger [Phycisphaerales bacterium]|nr:MAG: sodium:proton exchanger [Phycisphaerales bacterium]
MQLWPILLDIVVLLAASLVLGAVCTRLGQSSLIGYLLAGMLLGGPGSVRAVRSEAEIGTIAELGVSLLLFSLGLEFSWRRLTSLGSRLLCSGSLQVVVTAAVASAAAALIGLRGSEAVAIGTMVALSSTACVLRVLMERSETDSVHGRNAVAILLVQDIAVVPLAVLMTLLGGGGSASATVMEIGRIVGMAAALLISLYVLLDVVAARALGSPAFQRNRELPILLAATTGLGATWAAHAAGVSPALGAFVAGMFLGSSPFATQIRADVSSLRVILLTLFFGSAGMVADPTWIIRHWSLVLGATTVLLAVKSGIIFLLLRAFGQPAATAAATGVCLAQIGEFAFVLGGIGRQSGVIGPQTYLLIVSATIASLFVSPYLVAAAPSIGGALARRWPSATGRDSPTSEPARPRPRVVFVGFGPTAQLASAALVDFYDALLVLDLNPAGKRAAEERGHRGVIGDATQLDVLEHCGLDAAELVAITIPDTATATTILRHVRRLAPEAHVVVRARHHRHAAGLQSAGAHAVIGDEEAIGLALREHLRDWAQRRQGGIAAGA